MAPPPSPSTRMQLEHALLLIARQHGASASAASAAREELARWRAQNPAHEAATQTALRGWAATDASALREELALPASAAMRKRRTLAVLGWAGAALVLGGAGRWYWQQPLQQLALATGRSQRLDHRLQDGSRVALAARTQLQATLYRHRRQIVLERGAAYFEVQADPERPFTVSTAWGRVQVLGTAFSVAVHDGGMQVAVAHGRVAVWNGPDAAGLPHVELGAGQSLRMGPQGMDRPQPVAAEEVGAWQRGWLVFNQTPLREAVDRWNDYLATPVRLGPEPALQALRLTGSFQLRDPGSFLASLPQALPVRLQADAQGAMTIHAR